MKKSKRTKFFVVFGCCAATVCVALLCLSIMGRNRRPNPILLQTKYVAHAQYLNDSLPPNSMSLFRTLVEKEGYKILELDVLFTKDTVPVLCHDWNVSEIAVDSFGTPADVVVEKVSYDELCKYNFAKNPSTDSWHQIDLFKDLVWYAKEKNVCLQIDIQKWVFPKEYCRILYDIVAEADMLNSVFWEVSDKNIRTFALFDPFLNYQLDGKWTHKQLDLYRPLKLWSSLLIFSNQFHDMSNLNLEFKDIIEHGHRNGYLMKNSVINDSVMADSLFKQGTDMITTGCLK